MAFLISPFGLSCAVDVDQPTERIGLAAQAITDTPSAQVAVSPPGISALQPTAAWIPSWDLSLGYGLVGYTLATPTGDVTAWAHSSDWAFGQPDWTVQGRADMIMMPWPPPDNYADAYDPAIYQFGGYTGMAQVLWGGFKDLAIAVSYTQEAITGQTDVALIGSTDGGKTWKGTPKLITQPFRNDSGEWIDPGAGVVAGSVQASLWFSPERITEDAGTVAIPILVIWENFVPSVANELGRGWWFTEVLFGPDGDFVQTRNPVKLDKIPSGSVSTARASILGWTGIVGGAEVVEIAWSERSAPMPSCPTTQTISVTWKHIATLNYGKTWDCLDNTCNNADKITTITTDSAFHPCAGDSDKSPGDPTATPFNPINDRPELAISRNNLTRYMAFPKSYNTTNMRVEVWRDDFSLFVPWVQAWTSPPQDEYGRDLTHAFGPSLAVMQGEKSIAAAIIALTFRTTIREGGVSMQMARSEDSGFNWTLKTLTDGSGVPWDVSDYWGSYQGAAALQPCIVGCMAGQSVQIPDIPFLGVWVDQRASATSEIWVRRFPFKP